MSWSIRAVDPSEASRFAPFAADLFRESYGVTHPEPTLSDYLATSFATRRVRQSLADPASTTLLAEAADGTWIGYAELRAGGPTAPTTTLEIQLPGTSPLEIVRFYVDRAWHGQGVAQALMAACDEAARIRGCDALWLQAWQQAPQALRFYRKAGFAVHGTAVFAFGDRADSDFILARALVATPAPSREAAG
jgi:GNAT superfamily N-acetyltransferase